MRVTDGKDAGGHADTSVDDTIGVTIIVTDENDLVIGYPDPERLRLDLKGWVGTDANGYKFGPDMLSATEDGKWVFYVYQNPQSGDFGAGYTGELELKNVWVVRHDGLLFASGWYINGDEFTKSLVFAAVNKFRSAGLQATIEYFTGPESVYSGLAATIEYYNSAENVEGDWFAFVADPSGTIVDHYHKDMVGQDISDIFRHGHVRGHRRGQLGDHGGRARLGGGLRRDDVRLRLA